MIFSPLEVAVENTKCINKPFAGFNSMLLRRVDLTLYIVVILDLTPQLLEALRRYTRLILFL